MTVVSMSLFPSPHSQAPGLTIRPPHSILASSLTKSSQSLLTASQTKGKLGFSIDSIVGDRRPERSPRREEPHSPASRSPRDRSPLYRGRSPSPGLEDPQRRSPDSPPSPSLVRPIPTSGASTASYLDQLAQLKAFYEARGAAAAGLGPGHAGPGLTGLGLPGLHHAAVLSGLSVPRPPVSLPTGLPPFLGLPGQPGQPLPGQQLPREYPLYPWFLNRNRFPGGPPGLPEFLLPFRKPKRIRTAFSPSQLLKLEQAFENNQYVVGQERKELAKTLHLSETQVKVWFQNRRTKHKREETETDQAKALGGAGNSVVMGEAGQTIIEHDESEEEDIDCE